MAYEVEFASRAAREYRKLPRQEQRRIDDCVGRLTVDPHPPGSQKIQGYPGLFRVRVGDYRVVYDVQEAILLVLVLWIGHRREVYRGLDQL